MQATEKAPELVRGLNVWHATAIVVGTIIGSGIFLVPAEMMKAVGSAKLVYLAWIVGGLLSFFGALTYAELGALRPFAGLTRGFPWAMPGPWTTSSRRRSAHRRSAGS